MGLSSTSENHQTPPYLHFTKGCWPAVGATLARVKTKTCRDSHWSPIKAQCSRQSADSRLHSRHCGCHCHPWPALLAPVPPPALPPRPTRPCPPLPLYPPTRRGLWHCGIQGLWPQREAHGSLNHRFRPTGSEGKHDRANGRPLAKRRAKRASRRRPPSIRLPLPTVTARLARGGRPSPGKRGECKQHWCSCVSGYVWT